MQTKVNKSSFLFLSMAVNCNKVTTVAVSN